MEELSPKGHRFKRISRSFPATNSKLDPLLNENTEQWPHLNELFQCYKSDWIKDESKYGRYESITLKPLQNQIFEGPDTDIETEMLLSNTRNSKIEDSFDDNFPSTSGRQSSTFSSAEASLQTNLKHFGDSPLPAYEPAFDWENERSMVFGQRNLDYYSMPCGSNEFRIAVKVLSLSLQAGLVEPFYGTICLYNKERREKLSEDFYFHVQAMEMQEAKPSTEYRAVFSLDALSSSICLLIQLEKPATEDGELHPLFIHEKNL